jgi:hypothetical protein
MKKIIYLLTCFFTASSLAQSVPELINYQGRLMGAQGVPIVDGTYKLEFNIYDDATTGTKEWGPQVFTAVPVTNGMFNVILGEKETDLNGVKLTNGVLISAAFLESNRYLGIKVNSGAEISPRQKILSAPYALNAETLGGGTVNVVNGNVGIGTVDPSVKLDIVGSVNLTGQLDMAGNNIVNLGSPTSNSDAVTKAYVDAGDTLHILAAIRVNAGSIISKTPGVEYSSTSGVVTFPNPQNKTFVPVISNYKEAAYISDTHFIRNILNFTQFQVWRTALDTGTRDYPPTSFTAIVVGF